jgi:hypothetical protein
MQKDAATIGPLHVQLEGPHDFTKKHSRTPSTDCGLIDGSCATSDESR